MVVAGSVGMRELAGMRIDAREARSRQVSKGKTEDNLWSWKQPKKKEKRKKKRKEK